MSRLLMRVLLLSCVSVEAYAREITYTDNEDNQFTINYPDDVLKPYFDGPNVRCESPDGETSLRLNYFDGYNAMLTHPASQRSGTKGALTVAAKDIAYTFHSAQSVELNEDSCEGGNENGRTYEHYVFMDVELSRKDGKPIYTDEKLSNFSFNTWRSKVLCSLSGLVLCQLKR